MQGIVNATLYALAPVYLDENVERVHLNMYLGIFYAVVRLCRLLLLCCVVRS